MPESDVTTIKDCEAFVAAVDAGDKINVYRNWLGLMPGNIEATFENHGRTMTRRLNRERKYTGLDGSQVSPPCTSLMLVRNVGHLITADAIVDAIVTTARDEQYPAAAQGARQPNQQNLHREAEVARARRGGIREYAAREWKTCSASAAIPSSSA